MAISIFCPYCHKHTELSFAPVKCKDKYGLTFTTPATWESDDGRYWWIGVCNACQQPCLVQDRGVRVFPQPLPSPTDPNIPKELASDLDEAKMCLAVQCYRACAVMARRCIQNACIAKGAKSDNLIGQVKELTQTGVITKDIEEWATIIRWVGNDAAHPGKDPVLNEDAQDVLKLAEQFLHVIFVTPALAKARKTARGK
jgi:hypothetical protein